MEKTPPLDTWSPIHDLEGDIAPLQHHFAEQPGPRITLSPSSTPLEFFSLFFDDAIFQLLVDGTNEYAAEVIAEKERAGRLTPRSRWSNWKDVTISEMKAVLAIIINMGLIHCPEREGY